MSVWITILLTLLFISLLISLVLFFIQDRLIFQAEKLPKNHEFKFNSSFEEIDLKAEDGSILNGVLLKENVSKGLIIYFHNHSGNIKYCGQMVSIFQDNSYDVLMMDYRGYGKSTGSYNEGRMLNDTMLWYNYAKELYKPEDIILYGRGIGTYFTLFLASKYHFKFVILESTFYSLAKTAFAQYPYAPMNLVLKYRFDNSKMIQKVNTKIYMIHGDENELNKLSHAKKLFTLAKPTDEFILIKHGTHFNLRNKPEYEQKIAEILA